MESRKRTVQRRWHDQAGSSEGHVLTYRQVISNQMQSDQEIVTLAAKLNQSLQFATDAQTIRTRLQTVQPTVIKLFEQITECCIFIREYTGRGFASEYPMSSDDSTIR